MTKRKPLKTTGQGYKSRDGMPFVVCLESQKGYQRVERIGFATTRMEG